MIDAPATVSAQGAQEDNGAVLFMIAGTLTADWDQEVFDANGVDDLAIFRMGAFAAFIERGTFREARINDPALTRS